MAGHDAGVGASSGGDDGGVELSLRLGTPAPAPAGRKKNLTIVYDRRVLCAVDVVELQAMAIISMASRRETTTGKKTAITADDMDQDGAAIDDRRREGAAIPETGVADPAPAPAIGGGEQAGLSMKRSLQRFLEKRKARAAAAGSPYGVHRPAARPPAS